MAKSCFFPYRFLATGSSFRSLAFSFRMGLTPVAGIVSETVDILWEELQPVHMPAPTRTLFETIATEMWKVWNFPLCIGALYGKHVRVRCPKNSGSMFYNYKHFFSIVLQALVDAHYRFIVIDVGGYGKQSDGGTFQASSLYQAIMSGTLQIPEPTTLPDSNDVAPFVIVADEAYPLMNCLMKAYGGQNLPPDEVCFNKRLSRSRKTVECAFGIMTAKWRLLSKEIETDADLVDRIIKCICVLHNVIIDREGMDHNYTEVSCENSAVVWETRGRPSNDAKWTRDIFKTFFQNHPLVYTNRQ